jgi:hypothetical protein
VADGWSLGVLVDEVAALYGAFVQGQASPLSSCQSSTPTSPTGSAPRWTVLRFKSRLITGRRSWRRQRHY